LCHIDVKLLLLNKYKRVLKERAVLESSSQPLYLELLFVDMCVLTACGVVHWTVFDIINFWRGHSVVVCNNIATKSVKPSTLLSLI